ncbi:MAG: glycosyltransferase family 4 protein [Dehalococcoidia bacterium]
MRIAILLPELVAEGGGDRQAVYLARELQEMGHDVTVFTPAFDQRCYPAVCSQLRIVVTGRHALARLPLVPGRLRAFLDMLQLARSIREPLEVINPHHWPPHWAAVWAARVMSPAPAVVWMCNDPPWPPLAPVAEWRRLLWPARLLSRLLFFRLDRHLVRRISRTVVLSDYAKRLIDASFGIDCAVVRSGVDGAALAEEDPSAVGALRRRYSIPEDAFLLLSLGILMPHRRLEDAIQGVARAVATGHDIRFLIAGTPEQHPDYAESLRRLVTPMGLDGRVTFAGAVPENELKLYYHACDAFVFPNENQTWALAVSEAMACGRPVVVSTGAAITEALTDHQTALFVPPRDPEAIAAAIIRLVEDPALARAIGERGRRYVNEAMSWRRYARSMLAVFQESLAEEEAAESPLVSVGASKALQGQGR